MNGTLCGRLDTSSNFDGRYFSTPSTPCNAGHFPHPYMELGQEMRIRHMDPSISCGKDIPNWNTFLLENNISVSVCVSPWIHGN